MKLSLILLLVSAVLALDNGLGRTPPMGWNPWNKYGCNISEDLIKQTADALISTGLAKAGYVYINIDDCWQYARDKDDTILADPIRFKSGIPALVKYIHDKGLKIGLYSDAGFQTCQGKPGSLGYEEIDAKTYSDWDIDYLKYDNCHTDGSSPTKRYPPMSAALQKQSKKIYFSICEWGFEKPQIWAPPLANSWRTTGDISDNWVSFTWILERQVGLEEYAGPGQWNDPDMLEVGNGGMTSYEYQSHFALWALLKAPLLIGCDITNMSEDTKTILMNQEVIAVNQDPLGIQGKRIKKVLSSEVWAGRVVDGMAVILFNQAVLQEHISVTFAQLGLTGKQKVRDLINHQDLGVFDTEYGAKVQAHRVVMVKLTPA